ncbi:DsbA family protein [Candidatus Woesearchaeota archaeon]|nr:DsbA family protein [Candidatus Woesearchaeota archaeon]
MKTKGKHTYEQHEAHSEHKQHERESKTAESAINKKEEKAVDKKVPGSTYLLISAFILIIILLAVIFMLMRKQMPTTPPVSGEKVKVEFYVMSQCPYGTQVENAIAPVLKSMGDAVDFHLDFIVSETSPGTFQSLHGAKEVTGNIVQLCAMKYYPTNYKYIDFILCQNKDATNVDTNWVSCAQQNGMDVNKLKTCLEGEEGKTLLRESMQRATARNARGSPTMYIADSAYQGQRDSTSFQRAICQLSTSPACAEIPKCTTNADCTEQEGKEGYCINPGMKNAACEYREPVPVNYIILTSAKCGSACDTTNIVTALQQLFLGAKPSIVDVDSSEGKALVQKYNIEVVPAFLFETEITQTNTWQARTDLQSVFELKDDKYKILDDAAGASYFVSEEKRKAYYDSIGVVLGDNKPQIDFFVMSYCPYGNQAEEGIEPAYQLLKDKAIFNPRYVIYENYGGGGANYCIDSGKLCSMHGIQELNQDVRELCVNKHMGIGKWFEFALAMNSECTYQNADTCWEAVATKLKLDVAKIKKCQADEAVALLTAEKALGDKLGVSGSPTVFIDGEAYNGGRTPENYKTALCEKYDAAPNECSTNLGATSSTASGSC